MRQRPICSHTLLFAILVLLLAAPPRPATAQEVMPRAALGMGLGALGGVGITVATVVARARFQGEYINEPRDLIHWQSIPMLLAPAAGGVYGIHSWEALRGSFIGSASGFAVGVGVGALVGHLTTETAEGNWAGGAIGGGLGLAVGGLIGGYLGWREHEKNGTAPLVVEVRVPAGLFFSAGSR